MAAEQPVARDKPRVEMKPAGTVTGYVDGGWWPRSTDPAQEFPGLVEALHGVVGQVRRVVYNLDFWEPVQRKLTVAGQVVKCEGFHTMNAHTVTAIGANAARVTLLVVPPATPDDTAQAMLHTAADQDNTATVEDILASGGVETGQHTANLATPGRKQRADAVPDQRWEDEGGHVRGDDRTAANTAR